MKRKHQNINQAPETDGSFTHGSFRFDREKYGQARPPRENDPYYYEDEFGMRRAMDEEDAEDHFGKGPKNWQRTDERIRDDICDLLTHDRDLDASQIEVTVSEGLVTLRGDVEDRKQKHLAEDLADEIPGVRDIHNHLTIRKKVQGWIPGVGNESDERDQGPGFSKAMY